MKQHKQEHQNHERLILKEVHYYCIEVTILIYEAEITHTVTLTFSITSNPQDRNIPSIRYPKSEKRKEKKKPSPIYGESERIKNPRSASRFCRCPRPRTRCNRRPRLRPPRRGRRRYPR